MFRAPDTPPDPVFSTTSTSGRAALSLAIRSGLRSTTTSTLAGTTVWVSSAERPVRRSSQRSDEWVHTITVADCAPDLPLGRAM